MSAADNFMCLEPELVERLRTALADLVPAVHVLTAEDLAGVKEEAQLVPAVHLVYQSNNIVESSHNGATVRIEQTWLAIVATRNTRSLKTGADARSEAGKLARRVIAALAGWKAPSASKHLGMTDGPNAGLSAGFQYLPLAFKAEIMIRPA